MKTKEKQDLHTKTKDELLVLVTKRKEEIMKAKLEVPAKKPKNVNEIKTKMKDVARLLTIMHMKGEKNG